MAWDGFAWVPSDRTTGQLIDDMIASRRTPQVIPGASQATRNQARLVPPATGAQVNNPAHAWRSLDRGPNPGMAPASVRERAVIQHRNYAQQSGGMAPPNIQQRTLMHPSQEPLYGFDLNNAGYAPASGVAPLLRSRSDNVQS